MEFRLNYLFWRCKIEQENKNVRLFISYDLTHITLTKISSKTDVDFITPFMRMIVDGCKPFTAQSSLTILISSLSKAI